MFIAKTAKLRLLSGGQLRIAAVHGCKCGTYERCACLTEEAQRGKVSNRE